MGCEYISRAELTGFAVGSHVGLEKRKSSIRLQLREMFMSLEL